MECEVLYRSKDGTTRSKPKVTIARLADEDIEIIETREYNGRNQLIKVYKDGKNIIYSYKPDGMRYSKIIDDIKTTHVWDGESIVLDISGNNQVKGRYLRGSSLSARVQDNQTHYYLHNAHGDVVYLIDQNSNMIKHYDYSAFGIENKSEKNDSNTFRYCGEYYDGEIKNIYLRARYYNPRIGRFTSEDPARDGNNWYSYCCSNPISLVDRNGMWPSWGQIGAAIGIVLSTAVTAAAVIAAAPAVAAGAAAIAVSWGISAAVGSAVATVAVAATAGAVSISGGNRAVEAVSGRNLLLEKVYDGDQQKYENVEAVIAIAAHTTVEAGQAFAPLVEEQHSAEQVASTVEEGRLVDSEDIRFSQDSIKSTFSDGTPLETTINELKNGSLDPSAIGPIRVLPKDGNLYTLDNRRLYVAKEAGTQINCVNATNQQIANESWKFTTKNNGTSIRVRGK